MFLTLAEIFGGKWIFGIGILMTSIFTVIMPWAAKTDLRLLVAVRVLEGMFFFCENDLLLSVASKH